MDLSENNTAYIYLLFSYLHLDLAGELSFYTFRPRYVVHAFVSRGPDTHTTDPMSLHEMIVRTASLCTTLTRGNSAS